MCWQLMTSGGTSGHFPWTTSRCQIPCLLAAPALPQEFVSFSTPRHTADSVAQERVGDDALFSSFLSQKEGQNKQALASPGWFLQACTNYLSSLGWHLTNADEMLLLKGEKPTERHSLCCNRPGSGGTWRRLVACGLLLPPALLSLGCSVMFQA